MTTKPRKTRTSKNLTVRGDTYYFRKTIGGKPYNVSTDIRVGGTPEFELAEKRARQIEIDIHEGRFGFKAKIVKASTVGAWLDRFIESHGSTVSPLTRAGFFSASALMRGTVVDGETWEDRDLRTITEADCKSLLGALERGTLKASNSRRTFHTFGGNVWSKAIKEKLVEENPWRFKRTRAIPRERVLTVQEQGCVWPFLLPYYQRVMTLEVLAGLRASCELAALKEADVDFVNRRVFVRKGKGSKQRYVPLAPAAVTAIREQLDANRRGEPGTTNITALMLRKIAAGYVFPITSRMALRAWADAAEKAEVSPFTSHDLRRTFGTRCAEANVPMKKLQLWMGHSDIRVTAQFYVHLSTDSDDRFVEQLAARAGMTERVETAVQPERCPLCGQVVTEVVTLV